jgi:hypothetical protein
MSDLDFTQSAGITGVIGMTTTGVETTPLVVNSDGSINVVTTITTGSPGVPQLTSKLRVVDMNASSGGVARSTSIGTTWTDIFNYSGSGLLTGFLVNFESETLWNIRLIIDTEEVFSSNGIAINDMVNSALYALDDGVDRNTPGFGIQLSDDHKFRWNSPLGLPIKYTTNITIKAKASSSKQFRAGFITLTKDT